MATYTPKTGTVWIRDFDLGVILQLGSYLRTVSPGKNNYYLKFTSGLSNETDEDVPVIFNNPEQVYEGKIYPCIVVKRESMEPALARWHSYGHFDYVAGEGVPRVVDGQTVYDQVESKPQAWPYDITYTISCYSRYESEAQTLLRQIMRRFQPRGHMLVRDTLGDERGYTFFCDPAVSDIGEFVDVAERMRGYSVSVRVEGEIDLVDPKVQDTVAEVVINQGVP